MYPLHISSVATLLLRHSAQQAFSPPFIPSTPKLSIYTSILSHFTTKNESQQNKYRLCAIEASSLLEFVLQGVSKPLFKRQIHGPSYLGEQFGCIEAENAILFLRQGSAATFLSWAAPSNQASKVGTAHKPQFCAWTSSLGAFRVSSDRCSGPKLAG